MKTIIFSAFQPLSLERTPFPLKQCLFLRQLAFNAVVTINVNEKFSRYLLAFSPKIIVTYANENRPVGNGKFDSPCLLEE